MICNHCFDSEVIAELIVENGVQGSSDYCCEKCLKCNEDVKDSMFCMSKSDLVEQLAKSIRNLYVYIDEYQLAGGGNKSYLSLEEVCYKVFDLWDDGDKLAQIIIDEYSYELDSGFETGYYSVWLPICYLERDSFDWDDFSKKVKHSLRFFDSNEFNRKEELQKLDSFFEKFCVDDFERVVFRSRGITEKDIKSIDNDPKKELGKAPSKLAKHNRFSPSGISYIYLASDENTAIHEVFDEAKEIYAVGKFELKENLKLIDLRKSIIKDSIKKYINPFSNDFKSSIYCASKELEQFVIEIQKPISNENKDLEYLPTQILAEYIRFLAYDGFIFDSSKNIDGYNIILFDEQMTYKEYSFSNVSLTSINLHISKIVNAMRD